MGSFGDLRIGGYEVLSQKYRITQDVLSIFVESDKVLSGSAPDLPIKSRDGDEEDTFCGYASTAAAISDRLDLMGFTPDSVRADFSLLLANVIEEKSRIAETWTDREGDNNLYSQIRARAENEIAFLANLNFEAWLAAAHRIKADNVRWINFDADNRKSIYSRELDQFEAHVLNAHNEDEHPPLGFYCSDLRSLIRAFLLCAAPSDWVVLDCTDMVCAGYFDAADPITEQARAAVTADARRVEKILILTEGCSDTRLLRETLDVLFPHLHDFVSFLDHDQFSIPGGAGNLLNLLRGFAGAGVSNRVVALFDNDAAGSVQIAKAASITLPRNFRVLQLPYFSFGELYPTLGPTGPIETNINGSACSIELYLGRPALLETDGTLMPIQWMGYEKSLARYQGELVDKQAVQRRYLEALRRGHADTSNMKLIFEHIRRAFHSS